VGGNLGRIVTMEELQELMKKMRGGLHTCIGSKVSALVLLAD